MPQLPSPLTPKIPPRMLRRGKPRAVTSNKSLTLRFRVVFSSLRVGVASLFPGQVAEKILGQGILLLRVVRQIMYTDLVA